MNTSWPPRTAPLFLSYAVASFFAVASGCVTAWQADIPPAVWLRNIAAWVIGAILAILLASIGAAGFARGLALVAPFVLLLTRFDPGQSGVHRWISIGPLHWNVAFLCLPATVVAFAAGRSSPRLAIGLAIGIQWALCLQPDASQATAFSAAILAALWTTRPALPHRLTASLLVFLPTFLTWLRPDPLSPIPEVEGILRLAASRSGLLAAICVATLVLAAVSPLVEHAAAWPATLSLSVYFLICSLMPLLGAYPVPLLGMGMSPIIGFWIGIGALTTLCDADQTRR